MLSGAPSCLATSFGLASLPAALFPLAITYVAVARYARNRMTYRQTIATLSQLTAPPGVTLLDDPDETVLATVTPPTKEPEPDEIETETGVVGEGEELPEGEADAEGESGGDADEQASGDES